MIFHEGDLSDHSRGSKDTTRTIGHSRFSVSLSGFIDSELKVCLAESQMYLVIEPF